MILRSSISNTKKFFQKTIESFKSFFSPGYQKLPKTPPHHQFSHSVALANTMSDMNNQPSYNKELDRLEKFYSDFTDQWDSEKEKVNKSRSKKKIMVQSPTKQEKYVAASNANPAQNKNQMERKEEINDNDSKKKSWITQEKGRQEDSSLSCKGKKKEERSWMVAEKLKELEMLDIGNVDYVLDIEEVLHYYSRLTCPAYLEIVDKFFVEMCSEFFGSARSHHRPATPASVNSKLKLRSVRS